MFVAEEGVNEGVNKSDNRIAFDNFIHQAREMIILTYKKGCIKSWTGAPLDSASTSTHYYNLLYDLLLDIKVIDSKLDAVAGYIEGMPYVYNINPKFVSESYIKTNCEKKIKESSKYSELKCLDINYKKLVQLLKNYKYGIVDKYKVLVNPAGNNINAKHAASKKKRGDKYNKLRKSKRRKLRKLR